jgi:hypothetical protein
MPDDLNLSELDRVALERCLHRAQRDPDRAGQLQKMLDDRPWQTVARFACHVIQKRSLHLRPWEVPPCSVSENASDARDTDAQRLLRKMLQAGLSRYEPDPIRAMKNKSVA